METIAEVPQRNLQPVLDMDIEDNEENAQPRQYEMNSQQMNEAEDLFNQISIDEPARQRQQKQENFGTPVKVLKKAKKMEIDSMDQDDGKIVDEQKQEDIQRKEFSSKKKSKKQIKQQKKELKKLRKKQKKKNKKLIKKEKRLRKAQENNQNLDAGAKQQKSDKQQKWSGSEDSQSMSENDSMSSEDSLLNKLNPRKKLVKSGQRVRSTEKKQGFSLKQLGNDGQVNYDKQDELNESDDDYSDKPKKNSKKLGNKKQKKNVIGNTQMLRSLLEGGLCVDEQQQNGERSNEVDNGLQQVYNMKNSKKNAVKIKNKLFVDIDLEELQRDKPSSNMPEEIQLQVKQKVKSTVEPAFFSSFLNKTEKILKARGMQSKIQNDQFEKINKDKVKESLSQLVSKKQLEEADQIELDVLVPEVVKGRQQINNSLFLKTVQDQKSASAKKQKQKIDYKIKIDRFSFFKQISGQVKVRKSRDVTHQTVKNSFKITQLEELQEVRKRNEERRRIEAEKGSDYESDQQQRDYQKLVNQMQREDVVENKLQFMNFTIDVPNENIEAVGEQIKQKVEDKIVIQIEKEVPAPTQQEQRQEIQIKQAKPQAPKLTDEEFKKLIRLEQGIQGQEIEQEQQQSNKDQNELDLSVQIPQQKQKQDELEEEHQAEAEEQNNLQGNQMEEEQDDQQSEQEAEAQLQSSQPNKKQKNQEYQQYLNELENQGINIKKKKRNNIESDDQMAVQKQGSKANDQLQFNNKQEEARRQFRKLRKFATILKQKRKVQAKIKKAGEFYDDEAQEGSDNQDHDGNVKKINYDEQQKQYEGIDLDAELEELIDNAVDINEQDEELAYKKFREQINLQDREDLKRIMRGDFKRGDRIEMGDQIEDDEKERLRRLQIFQNYMKKNDEEQKDMFMSQKQDNSQQCEQNSQSDSDQNAQKNNQNGQKQAVQTEQIDDMDEQKLRRYFEQNVVQTDRKTIKIEVKLPKLLIRESYVRQKSMGVRNKLKEDFEVANPESNPKMKKTTSHLSSIIMKNKPEVKKISFLKNPLISSKKR